MGAWPRQVFEKIGLFDEELVRDQDRMMSLTTACGQPVPKFCLAQKSNRDIPCAAHQPLFGNNTSNMITGKCASCKNIRARWVCVSLSHLLLCWHCCYLYYLCFFHPPFFISICPLALSWCQHPRTCLRLHPNVVRELPTASASQIWPDKILKPLDR